MKDTITILKYVVDFINQLTEDQIIALVNKKAKLQFEYVNSNKSTKMDLDKSQRDFDVDSICRKIESLDSREEVNNYLESLSLDKNTLMGILKKYSIRFSTKDTNQNMLKKIVDGVIGAKLRFDALLNTNLE